MSTVAVRNALPKLLEARVANVTITGGEPLVHPGLIQIMGQLVSAGVDVTICTNAVQLTEAVVEAAAELGRTSFNVSLDGTSADSHGRFRGDRSSFELTLANARRLAQAGLLKGILCTPNSFAEPSEYSELFELAKELGAEYLLMNPLSSLGRGIRSRRRLRADDRALADIRANIGAVGGAGSPDVVFVRFPDRERPLDGCIAGDIFYVFVNGDVAVCPYLVFATENPGSQHERDEFIVGNVFTDADIAERLDRFGFHGRYQVGPNALCSSCDADGDCGKGCPAAVVARGGRIGGVDIEVCPRLPGQATRAS
jgi:radical SAM protein with 4Fe4S-binding SPASM domain